MISTIFTAGPFAFITSSKRDDLGLRRHEEKHIEQFWRYYGWFPIFYLLSEKFRLKAEVEAYREQLRYYPDDRTELFAWYIANKYRIDITVPEAVKLLCTETNRD